MGAKFSDEKKSNGEVISDCVFLLQCENIIGKTRIKMLKDSGLIVSKELEEKCRICSPHEFFSMKIVYNYRKKSPDKKPPIWCKNIILTVNEWIKVQKDNKIGFEHEGKIFYVKNSDLMLLA
jgi:hypothetical protein